VSPAAGPICGGFIAQRLGWRWAYWILIIASGVMTTLLTFFMNECYAPEILKRKTKRLRKELGREDLKSKLTLDISKSAYIKRSLHRPIKLLTRSPVVVLFALYVATIYGMLCNVIRPKLLYHFPNDS
jgi:MFS family permease